MDRATRSDLISLCPFFFNDTATTEIYTLSLHDALPICPATLAARRPRVPLPDRRLPRRLVGYRAHVATECRSPRRAAPAARPTCAHAVTGPGDRDGRLRRAMWASRMRPTFVACAAGGRRDLPTQAASGARSGSRPATAARCPGRRGRT